MKLDLLKVFSFVVLIITVFAFSNNAFAITPEKYCQIHEQSGAPGTCTPKGDCAVLTTNLGTEECKKCTEGGCTLTDCKNCKK